MEHSLEIDLPSDCEYPRVISGNSRRLDIELDANKIPWERPQFPNYIPTHPIKDAKVQRVVNNNEIRQHRRELNSGRYQGFKPLWLMAEIKKCHINTGEMTNVAPTLAKIIGARGISSDPTNDNDDCGHVIAASLGGKMVDFNLFPQNQSLNRGWKSNYFIWRVIESCIKLWVTIIPENYNPRVEFQMLLWYNFNGNSAMSQKYPDRPDKFKYMARFLIDNDSSDDESDDENETEIIHLSNIVLNIVNVSLQCRNEGVSELKTRIKQTAAQLSDRCKRHVDEFVKEIFELTSNIECSTPEDCPEESHGSYRHRNISAWDFVPVVGSVKALIEGCEDVADGYNASAATNLVVGTASLALDVMTVGAYSTFTGGLTKILTKEAAKGAAKQVTVKAIEKTGEAAVKTIGLYAASSAVKKLGKM